MKKISYFLLGFFFIFLTGLIILPIIFSTSLTPQKIDEAIEIYGIWAPVIIMLLLVAICFFSIVPTTPLIIALGYLVGTLRGTIYTVLSIMIGISLVFALSRYFGRPFVERLVEKETLAKADIFVRKWGVWTLLIQRFLPLFPENISCVSFGLTKMKYRTFIGISLLSIVPGAVLQTYIGAKMSDAGQIKNIFILLVTTFIIISLLILLFRKRIESWFVREIKTIEKDITRGKEKGAKKTSNLEATQETEPTEKKQVSLLKTKNL